MVHRDDHRRGSRGPGGASQLSTESAAAAHSHWPGFLLVAFGAVLLSSKGIFAKLLYAQGVDFHTVVSVRAVLAVPGFILLALLSKRRADLLAAGPSALMMASLAGFVCYYLGALANFYALTRVDASVERALLYSYPAMIVVAMWLVRRKRPSGRILGALVMTFFGIILTVGLLNNDLPAQDLAGVGWILFCSATICFYFIVTSRLARVIGAANYTAVAMATAGIAYAIHFQQVRGWGTLDLSPESWMVMGLLTIFATVLPLYLTAEGLHRIGAEKAALASTIAPASTVLLAIALLGETVSAEQIAGIVLIVLGILSLETRRARTRTPF